MVWMVDDGEYRSLKDGLDCELMIYDDLDD